jgi:hypothetical protein
VDVPARDVRTRGQAENRRLRDLSRGEFWILAPLVVMIFWLGIYPTTFTRKMDSTLNATLNEYASQRPLTYPNKAGAPASAVAAARPVAGEQLEAERGQRIEGYMRRDTFIPASTILRGANP